MFNIAISTECDTPLQLDLHTTIALFTVATTNTCTTTATNSITIITISSSSLPSS